MARSRLNLGGFPEKRKRPLEEGVEAESEGVVWLLPGLDLEHTHSQIHIYSVPGVLGTRSLHPQQ